MSDKSPLRDLWNQYVEMHGRIAPATQQEYDVYGNKFCRFAEGKVINTDLLKEWVIYNIRTPMPVIKRPISASKLNHMNIRIRGFMRWLHRFGHLKTDLSGVLTKIPEALPKDAQIITNEEYERLKEIGSRVARYSLHRFLCILSCRTGMNMKDCCYLRWKDVVLNFNGHSFIDIYRIKTIRLGSKARCQIPLIPLTDVFNELVIRKNHKNYQRHDGINDYVHEDAPGLYEVRQVLLDQFSKFFRRANIPKEKTFRHFRNTFISNLVNAGTPVHLIMKMTGHGNPKTIMRYLKADPRAMTEGLSQSFKYAAALDEPSDAGKLII